MQAEKCWCECVCAWVLVNNSGKKDRKKTINKHKNISLQIYSFVVPVNGVAVLLFGFIGSSDSSWSRCSGSSGYRCMDAQVVAVVIAV